MHEKGGSEPVAAVLCNLGGKDDVFFWHFPLFSMQFTIACSHLSMNRDQSASQAWDSCRGGQTVSCHQSLLHRKSFQRMFGG